MNQNVLLNQICHLLNNFIHCSAYEHIIFCWVMHEQRIIDDILTRLDVFHCNIRNISLVCDAESLKARLEKDISSGRRSSDIIDRSVARIPLYCSLNTEKIDTSGKSAAQIADLIAGSIHK